MIMDDLTKEQKQVAKETAAIFISHYMETGFWKNMSSEKKEEFVLSEILDSMSYLMNSSEGLSRMLEILDILNKNDSSEEDKNEIEVIRYLRPGHSHGNNYGVTAIFNINYDKETVEARFSVCNGDNFDKKKGVQIARNSKVVINFPLSEADEFHGLMNALLWHVGGVPDDPYKLNHNMFLFALGYKV